jgi:hypothetical protein
MGWNERDPHNFREKVDIRECQSSACKQDVWRTTQFPCWRRVYSNRLQGGCIKFPPLMWKDAKMTKKFVLWTEVRKYSTPACDSDRRRLAIYPLFSVPNGCIVLDLLVAFLAATFVFFRSRTRRFFVTALWQRLTQFLTQA